MARTSTYLHFDGTAEGAFTLYREAFGTELDGAITRMGDLPAQPGHPELTADEKQKVMSVRLPITGGHLLVGNDVPVWMGTLTHGNAMDIGVELDTRAEAERVFTTLSAGATVEFPFQDMGGGNFFGSLVDRYGIQWLVSCPGEA